jgi:NAD(P)-dependent dehydrogenase (short-subunit alcohol dehydrogenase family)
MLSTTKAGLVTGASSGLGRATAIALALSGADVELIVSLAASPPEFVLTEGIVLPIEEGPP